jgi:hypothetical protein
MRLLQAAGEHRGKSLFHRAQLDGHGLELVRAAFHQARSLAHRELDAAGEPEFELRGAREDQRLARQLQHQGFARALARQRPQLVGGARDGIREGAQIRSESFDQRAHGEDIRSLLIGLEAEERRELST